MHEHLRLLFQKSLLLMTLVYLVYPLAVDQMHQTYYLCQEAPRSLTLLTMRHCSFLPVRHKVLLSAILRHLKKLSLFVWEAERQIASCTYSKGPCNHEMTIVLHKQDLNNVYLRVYPILCILNSLHEMLWLKLVCFGSQICRSWWSRGGRQGRRSPSWIASPVHNHAHVWNIYWKAANHLFGVLLIKCWSNSKTTGIGVLA